MAMVQRERIEIIEYLRGLAAISVMWYHFTGPAGLFEEYGALGAWLGGKGWLGVEVFFVISGFILPFSMHRAHYRLADFGTFVVKRIIRLDPPYLANILLVLFIWYAAGLVPHFEGVSFSLEPVRILCHLGYLNAIVGFGWYNPVYWTLAIEFQYYLLLALSVPLLTHPQAALRWLFPLLLALGGWVLPQRNLVFFWLGLFALGMVTFQMRRGLIQHWQYAVSMAVIAALNVVTYGWTIAVVGLATAVTIAVVRPPKVAWLAFLGMISYSLYLVHLPIGVRFIRLGVRMTDSLTGRFVVLGVSIAMTLWAAYLWYRCFERPAQRWSAAIRYKGE